MLVRQQSKQIAISREGKILSVVKGTHEYAVRKKVYNFSQIGNDEEDRNYPALTESKINIGKENDVLKRKEQDVMFAGEESDVGKVVMHVKNANLKRKNQRAADDNDEVKGESHVLLKIIATVLVILTILTLIQTLSPNTLTPFIQALHTIKTAIPFKQSPTNNDL